jgi:hypothetical protein
MQETGPTNSKPLIQPDLEPIVGVNHAVNSAHNKPTMAVIGGAVEHPKPAGAVDPTALEPQAGHVKEPVADRVVVPATVHQPAGAREARRRLRFLRILHHLPQRFPEREERS